MTYNRDMNFWEMGDYKNAHLSKIDLPDEVLEKIHRYWKNPKGMLIFLGNPGCGKSYLIAAFINALQTRNGLWMRYLKERDLYRRMRDCIEKSWDYEYEINTLCETTWIFLDDIGSTQCTDFQKECLFSLIDNRHISGLPTVITSNHFTEDLQKIYPERLVSRLKDKKNTLIELNWIDKRQDESRNPYTTDKNS